MSNVTIYTKDYCPYCTRAKSLLDAKGVPYDEVDITHDTTLQTDMRALSGRQTVPRPSTRIDRRQQARSHGPSHRARPRR